MTWEELEALFQEQDIPILWDGRLGTATGIVKTFDHHSLVLGPRIQVGVLFPETKEESRVEKTFILNRNLFFREGVLVVVPDAS
jgi:hypothetical protein